MEGLAKDQPSIRLVARSLLELELQEFVIDRRSRGLTTKTMRWYAGSLDHFARFCATVGVTSLRDLAPSHVRRFLLALTERGHNPGGVKNIYGAVKALCNWYAAEYPDWINPLARVANPKAPSIIQQPVPLETVQALLATCKRRTFAGDRDKALLLFLLDSGVRHAELHALNVGDVDLVTGLVLVRCGKGRKPRMTVIGAKARRAIAAYLRHRPAIGDDAPLWVTASGDRLSYGGLRQVIRRRAKRAGVREPSLHAFRRAFALAMLRGGADVYSLQRMMGHADLSVLRRYLAQTDSDLQAAHGKASPVDRLLR